MKVSSTTYSSFCLLICIGLLTGCASAPMPATSPGEYVVDTFHWDESSRGKVYAQASQICSQKGLAMEPLREGANIGRDLHYTLFFRCFDEVQRNRELRAEAERKAAIQREKDRIAAIEAKKEQDRRDAEQRKAQQEYERKQAEAERLRQQRRESLRKAGIYQTTVIDLIVNFNSFRGRRVFIRCNLHSADKFGTTCDDLNNDKQTLSLDPDQMDRDLKRWLLENCSNYYYRDNTYKCRNFGIIGTVTGSSIPSISSASPYDND